MINAIIVDDEQMAIKALRGLIEEKFEELCITGEANNVPDAVRLIQKLKPQVVFLDVEMPEYNGFDLLDFFQVEQIDFQIVFVTAYSQYSLQAFEISATDYLLKPVRIEHMARAIEKIKKNIPKNLSYQVLKENLQEENESEQKIILHTAENIFVIKLSDIYYLEAQGSYTKFITHSHKDLLISKKISDFSFLEENMFFFRTHRSYIVNLQKIIRIDKKEYTIELVNQQSVYLAQERKKSLLDKLQMLT